MSRTWKILDSEVQAFLWGRKRGRQSLCQELGPVKGRREVLLSSSRKLSSCSLGPVTPYVRASTERGQCPFAYTYIHGRISPVFIKCRSPSTEASFAWLHVHNDGSFAVWVILPTVCLPLGLARGSLRMPPVGTER